MKKNDKHIFYNFLQSLTPDDKDLFLRTLSDWEIMDYCSCEDEYRTITGNEIPESFAAYRPDKVTDHDFPVGETPTEEELQKRLDSIKEAFKTKPSMDRLKAMANGKMEMPEPKTSINITVNLGKPEEEEEESEEEDA